MAGIFGDFDWPTDFDEQRAVSAVGRKRRPLAPAVLDSRPVTVSGARSAAPAASSLPPRTQTTVTPVTAWFDGVLASRKEESRCPQDAE